MRGDFSGGGESGAGLRVGCVVRVDGFLEELFFRRGCLGWLWERSVFFLQVFLGAFGSQRPHACGHYSPA